VSNQNKSCNGSATPTIDIRKVVVSLVTAGIAGILLIAGLTLFIPFFEPITWAIILALFFYPVFKRIRKAFRGSSSVAALIMCILIMLFIIVPFFYLLGSLTSEVVRVYEQVQEKVQSGEFWVIPDKQKYPRLNKAVVRALEIMDTHEQKIKDSIIDFSKKTGEFILKQGTVIFRNLANIIFKAAMMLVILYYLFRDGQQMLEAFKDLIPLSPEDTERFTSLTHDVLSATLYGNFLTAFIQAAAGIFILWALGFTAPVFWGTLIGLATFIPMIGTATVWLPATIFLFASGAYLKGVILLVYSILIISQIDYFLRPIFISGKTQLHSLFLLLSIIGGLNVFGLLGLVLGPILLALCMAILETYRMNLLGRSVSMAE